MNDVSLCVSNCHLCFISPSFHQTDSDSTFENNLGRRRNTGSSTSNISLSSGMASMSSVCPHSAHYETCVSDKKRNAMHVACENAPLKKRFLNLIHVNSWNLTLIFFFFSWIKDRYKKIEMRVVILSTNATLHLSLWFSQFSDVYPRFAYTYTYTFNVKHLRYFLNQLSMFLRQVWFIHVPITI